MDKGTFVSRAEAERTTVADWLDTYEKDFTAAKKGKDKEKSVIAALKASKLGPRMMSTITPADAAKLRDGWLGILARYGKSSVQCPFPCFQCCKNRRGDDEPCRC